MKTLSKYILLTGLFVLLGFKASAQTPRSLTLDAGSSMIMQEFKAVLSEEDGNIKVRLKLGNNDEEGDQLEVGDFILMMNGKRFKTITELREIYDSIAKDEEVKIGVRRDNERFIITKKKGDVPQPSAGSRSMVMDMSTSGGEAPTIIPELGLVVSDEDDNVIVQRVIDMLLPSDFAGLKLEGHTIKSINGKTPETAEEAKGMIDKLETGMEISFVFAKSGEEIKTTIKKPETRATIRNRKID